MATRWSKRTIGSAALAVLLLVVLVACGGGNQPPAKGSLAGTVVVGSALSDTAVEQRAGASTVPGAGVLVDEVPGAADLPDFVAGELIVGFKDVPGVSAASALDARGMLEAAGVQMAMVRPLTPISAGLYRAPGLSKAETLELAAALMARPDVAFADPNYIYQPLAVPNDPLYDRQWHYDVIDMEGAWDVTTGSSGVVVAVLDTGILYSMSDPSKRHPDLAGRVLPGYDFIFDPDYAGDGDGRDDDPYDPLPAGQFHGTHVAGTIGAASNNGVGVAGVDWNAKILPIRVLGNGGGPLADILDGLLWAVGSSVAGAPINTNPADVINLSLGAPGGCLASWQSTLDFVSVSAVVVAAAGNSNQNASGFAPAGCAGVITVGATDRASERSWFSNYGSRIDVMAPGGDLDEDLDDDGFPDGVLSLGYVSNFTYTFLQGTSMAAPHVSGIVALMKALDPTVDTARALEALRASATPLTDSACDGQGAGRDLVSIDCGAGIIDAAIALGFIDTGVIPDPPGAYLRFRPSALEFGATQTRIDVTLTNISGTTLDWELNYYEEAGDNPGLIAPGAFDFAPGSPESGTLVAGASAQTAIVIDRSKLSADGNYHVHLIFEVDDGTTPAEQLLLMRFTKTSTATPTLSGPMIVAAYIEDEFGNIVTSGYQSSAGAITSFDFEVAPGQNLLAAWADKNDNGDVDDGDLFGVYQTILDVAPGARLTGLVVAVDPFFGAPDQDANVIEALQRLAEVGGGAKAPGLKAR